MPRSPVALIIALSATLFAAFALNSGASLQSSLLALRASAEGFAPVYTGIIMASYYIGFVAGIIWGRALSTGSATSGHLPHWHRPRRPSHFCMPFWSIRLLGRCFAS